jgi:hypothetical protein
MSALDHPMASEEMCWQELEWGPLLVEAVLEVPEEAWRRLQQHLVSTEEPFAGVATWTRMDDFHHRESGRSNPQTICTIQENENLGAFHGLTSQ